MNLTCGLSPNLALSTSCNPRAATVKVQKGDQQNHDNHFQPWVSLKLRHPLKVPNILSDFVTLSTFDGSQKKTVAMHLLFRFRTLQPNFCWAKKRVLSTRNQQANVVLFLCQMPLRHSRVLLGMLSRIWWKSRDDVPKKIRRNLWLGVLWRLTFWRFSQLFLLDFDAWFINRFVRKRWLFWCIPVSWYYLQLGSSLMV